MNMPELNISMASKYILNGPHLIGFIIYETDKESTKCGHLLLAKNKNKNVYFRERLGLSFLALLF